MKSAGKYNIIKIPTREGKIMACEDYPCCGHEMGDCEGKLYGSDEAIKARAIARIRSEKYDAYYDED